ncbi:MAG: hypothetical protein R3C44_15740 [Chloroflexota bacterium]
MPITSIPARWRELLQRRGFKVNRATLYRWCSGTILTPDKLEVVRHLPRAMGLSAAEETTFLEAAGGTLGVELRPDRNWRSPTFDLSPRIHYGTQEFPRLPVGRMS